MEIRTVIAFPDETEQHLHTYALYGSVNFGGGAISGNLPNCIPQSCREESAPTAIIQLQYPLSHLQGHSFLPLPPKKKYTLRRPFPLRRFFLSPSPVRGLADPKRPTDSPTLASEQASPIKQTGNTPAIHLPPSLRGGTGAAAHALLPSCGELLLLRHLSSSHSSSTRSRAELVSHAHFAWQRRRLCTRTMASAASHAATASLPLLGAPAKKVLAYWPRLRGGRKASPMEKASNPLTVRTSLKLLAGKRRGGGHGGTKMVRCASVIL